ncbi:glycosyltransferase family 2 protein [Flavobacterium sp. 7A]|uniref:glycosyltransferase family 2 protein n=1 Tax=Flavobacterium sp. 7A TaxID=2940571 RepID=UPI0022260E7A|nr:glycosyltransferase family A protein [Flavobacterium sp. 7A]MCW2120587.1 glycosyltransferase involved in cell wall biosynthesis [Flavobacterium sp. 7A]
MQSKPLVTVICMCYNHSAYVIESLNSVLNQTYPNIELIIADDASIDNSKDIIENWLMQYPEIPFVSNLENIGNNKTFNKAFMLSKGDYFIDLAADDVLTPDCIEKQINTFLSSEYENIGMVYGNAELISIDGNHLSYYYNIDAAYKATPPPPSGDIYCSVIGYRNYICSVSSMLKRETFIALNGYDEKLAFEDMDYWFRCSRDYNIVFIDAILVKKRVIPNSLGRVFYKKLNPFTNKLNHTVLLVIKKAVKMNKTKEENRELLNRIYLEMDKAMRTLNLPLLLKYIPMAFKMRFS